MKEPCDPMRMTRDPAAVFPEGPDPRLFICMGSGWGGRGWPDELAITPTSAPPPVFWLRGKPGLSQRGATCHHNDL